MKLLRARPRRSYLATLTGALVATALLFPVLTAGVAQAQPAYICQDDGCNPPPPRPSSPPTETFGQNLTAITLSTNTGFSCTFGFPVVTVTFATHVAMWTATVQCSGPVQEIDGRTVFDTWRFPTATNSVGSINCTNGICGGLVPSLGGGITTETLSGSANLTPGVSYGVEVQMGVVAPPGQSWVNSPGLFSNDPMGNCVATMANFIGMGCFLDTGPFSVP